MPPPPEAIAKAAATLGRVRLESFAASPTRMRPFQHSILKWKATTLDSSLDPALRFRLSWLGGAVDVGIQGSRSVSPTETTTYTFVAVRPPLSKQLGSATMEVDRSACLNLSLPEQDLRDQITTAVDKLLAQNPNLKRRRPDSVEVDSSGIRLNLALKAQVEDMPDPDLNVEALIKLWAENGEPKYTLAKYGADLDFPWWFDLAASTLLPAWLAIALQEGHVENTIRNHLTKSIKEWLDDIQNTLRSLNFRLLTVTTASDAINYTVCPG